MSKCMCIVHCSLSTVLAGVSDSNHRTSMAGPALMSTSGARRVGMSVKQRPRPLLSQIGGRPVERLESVDTSDSEFPRKMSSDVKSQEYDPFTAPPESSDEEDNNKPPVKGFKGFSSDSDDDGPPPGDIQPTKFGKRNQQPSSQTSNAPGRTRRITTTKAYSTARSSQTEAPSSSAGSKRSGEESGLAKSGSHLEDGFGFCKKPKTTKRTQIHAPGRRQTKQFGGKSSQNSIPRSSAPQRDGQFSASSAIYMYICSLTSMSQYSPSASIQEL